MRKFSLPLLCVLFLSVLSACQTYQDKFRAWAAATEDRFEATNSLLAESKKDGVFLTTCTITPSTVAVGDSFLLDVQEAFIEQRFSTGSTTDKVKLMDSLEVQPKLVIIAKPNSRLRPMTVGYSTALQLRDAPFNSGYTSDNLIVLNLTKAQLHKKFACVISLEIPNRPGRYQERSLTVQPHPITQPLDESYNASIAQAQQAGVLLATCTIPLPTFRSNGFQLRLQEAFIENRFLVGAHTHEVQLLDSGHVRPRLVLVATPDSHLGPAGATWDLTLPGGGQLTGYQEQAKVLAFDLPERDLHQPFTLLLRLRRPPAPDTIYTLQVRPTPVHPLPQAPRPAPAAAKPPLSLKPVPVPVGEFDEQRPIFNGSAAEAAQHGMLLAPCTLLPTAVAVGKHFLLVVREAFIEQPASITDYSRRIELDDAHLIGPRLVLAYAPSSRLGELGIDWDLELVTPGRNLACRVEGKDHILVFHLPRAYVHRPIAVRLKVRSKQGAWEEQLLQITPQSPNSM